MSRFVLVATLAFSTVACTAREDFGFNVWERPLDAIESSTASCQDLYDAQLEIMSDQIDQMEAVAASVSRGEIDAAEVSWRTVRDLQHHEERLRELARDQCSPIAEEILAFWREQSARYREICLGVEATYGWPC